LVGFLPEKGGSVEIWLTRFRRDGVVRVSDTGPGIAANEMSGSMDA
jgi:signal transduction histidine kinase